MRWNAHGRSSGCGTFPVALNGTSRSLASPRRLRAITTLVKSWIRMDPCCFAFTNGAHTSIPLWWARRTEHLVTGCSCSSESTTSKWPWRGHALSSAASKKSHTWTRILKQWSSHSAILTGTLSRSVRFLRADESAHSSGYWYSLAESLD